MSARSRLERFRDGRLVEALEPLLAAPDPDPRIAARLVVELLQVELPGLRIPKPKRTRDEQILDLRYAGVPASAIAERFGMNVRSIHRAIARELRRRRFNGAA